MKNLEKELEKLIENYGIDAVMRGLKNDHTDKVFIPNWFYQEHLEDMGFQFDDEYFDMCAFDEFMGDHNVSELTTNLVSEDYPEMWEEYIEENS